jgi:hypothetical protein
MKVPAILKNKYVCYALMALASLNVIGYLTVKAWECLALFTLTAYSAHCYCKNVSCAILAALFVANFVFGCGRVKEGFEDAMKGPVEHMVEAAENAELASTSTAGSDDPATVEASRKAAVLSNDANATAAAFAASKDSCCKNNIWKTISGDFTQKTKMLVLLRQQKKAKQRLNIANNLLTDYFIYN